MMDSSPPILPSGDPGPGPRPDRDQPPVLAPDRAGLRWSFELDLVSVLEAMGRPLRDWDGVDQEADLAAETEALGLLDAPPAAPDIPLPGQEHSAAAVSGEQPGAAGAGRPRAGGPSRAGGPGADISGAVAAALPTGPGLAAWLAGQDPATATGSDLAGMAGAFRRVASWAQARELELISHIAARSAAADPKAGLQADGRPAYVTDDAAAQVSLELVLSRTGAEAWTGLAVALRWRLPRTAAALAEGRIDTYRAKILAEAVIPLSDAAARAVEDRVILAAGDLTYGQMHAAVRRAVIAADPEGAEHRRQAAERRAAVRLYPDQDNTATLTGTCLPALDAAAAYARVCAIAQAMKAAGAGGGIPFLRAQVFLGLLLQTLPPIPPPVGRPPDNDPPPGDADDGWAPGAAGEPPSPPAGDGNAGDGDGGTTPPPGGTHPDGDYAGGYEDWDPRRGDPLDDHFASPAAQWPWPPIPPTVPATAAPGTGPPGTGPPSTGPLGTGPPSTGPPGTGPLGTGLPPSTRPLDTASSPGNPGRPPPGGLLDLTLPWRTLTGAADAPGTLGRIGPITAPQARQAVNLALREPRTEWRVILTDSGGCAMAVARVPRAHPAANRPDRAGAPTTTAAPDATTSVTADTSASAPSTTAIVGRVTLVMPADALDTAVDPGLSGGICTQILAAARRARDQARERAAADQRAPGGCAHTAASPAYQPPARIREYVTARDQTCRNPRCGQPAWRADLDHTIPFDQGGRTCPCDLGALCRHHHQLKQRPGWALAQPRPGIFRWTTPAGRTYPVKPDPYCA